jgi:Fe2+ or Zn2+ uptake regulation protein
MDNLECSGCKAEAALLSDVIRSATPGIGLDRIVFICTKCGQKDEYFSDEAKKADELWREAKKNQSKKVEV